MYIIHQYEQANRNIHACPTVSNQTSLLSKPLLSIARNIRDGARFILLICFMNGLTKYMCKSLCYAHNRIIGLKPCSFPRKID